jgi:hypothetical protein
MDCAAAVIDPVLRIASNRAIFPGPIRPPDSRSMRIETWVSAIGKHPLVHRRPNAGALDASDGRRAELGKGRERRPDVGPLIGPLNQPLLLNSLSEAFCCIATAPFEAIEVAGLEPRVRSLYAARRSHCSAIISSPNRSHWLRQAFACWRASLARCRYSSEVGICL